MDGWIAKCLDTFLDDVEGWIRIIRLHSLCYFCLNYYTHIWYYWISFHSVLWLIYLFSVSFYVESENVLLHLQFTYIADWLSYPLNRFKEKHNQPTNFYFNHLPFLEILKVSQSKGFERMQKPRNLRNVPLVHLYITLYLNTAMNSH